MDKKTKVLFLVLILITLLSIAASYYRFVVLHDYEYYYDDYGEESLEDESGESSEITPET